MLISIKHNRKEIGLILQKESKKNIIFNIYIYIYIYINIYIYIYKFNILDIDGIVIITQQLMDFSLLMLYHLLESIRLKKCHFYHICLFGQ